MLRPFLLLTALLCGYNAHSQATGTKVCLEGRQAALIYDSLRSLGRVRVELDSQRRATRFFRTAADTGRAEAARWRAAAAGLGQNYAEQRTQTELAQADKKYYQKLARRRGFLNVVLVAGAVVLTWFAVSH